MSNNQNVKENPDYQRIAVALSDINYDGLELNGQFYPIRKNSQNGCRYLHYNGYCFMEQNKKKSTRWAEMARNGERIVWAIPQTGGTWVLFKNVNPPTL